MEDVTRHLPLVRTIAKRIYGRLPRYIELDDLVGAGVVALLNAARQFDETKGVPFERYAEVRIRGGIIDEIRRLSPATRRDVTRMGEIESATQDLSASLGRAPSQEEVASALGLSLECYIATLSRIAPVRVVSIDDLGPSGDDHRDAMEVIRDSGAEDPEAVARARELATFLAGAIGGLTPRRRQVVTFYYYEDMKFNEIAELLGLTEGRISQLHTAAIADLKAMLSGNLAEFADPS